MPQAVDDTTEILTGSKVPIFAFDFRACMEYTENCCSAEKVT